MVPSRRRAPVFATLLAAATLLSAGGLAGGGAGCGGRRGLEDGVYEKGAVRFRLSTPPPTWRKVDLGGATLAFRDDGAAASVLINARCPTANDAPLVALTNQLLIGTTERNIKLEETVPLDGREARHTRLDAKLDGVLLSYDVYVLKKDGCIYDFVLVGEPTRFDEAARAFEPFVMGFHTLDGAARGGRS